MHLPSIPTTPNIPGRIVTAGSPFALSFDGGDKITIADHVAFDVFTDQLTLEAFVKVSDRDLHTQQTILRKGDEFNSRIENGNFEGYVRCAGAIEKASSGSPAAEDTLLHTALVYRGTTVDYYVAGVRVGTASKTLNIDLSGDAVVIGNNDGGSEGWAGLLAGIRLSKTARYAGASFVPPTTRFVSDANTVLLFPMTEGTGTTITDISPNGLTGTFGVAGAAPTWVEASLFS